MMNEVEEYILRYKGPQRQILIFLHETLIQQANLKPKISYGIPMYQAKRNVAYLNPLKTGGVDLCFMDGQKLESGKRQLQFKDRKRVAGIEINSLEDIDEEQIDLLIREALAFDARKG